MAAPRPLSAAPRRTLAQPAILGGFDGMASLIGVIVYLAASHPTAIFPAALSGALSSAVSMGGGEFLSDSDSGWKTSAAMGAATLTGALAPAVPFAFSHSPLAVAECAVICAGIVLTVAAMRPARGLGLALAETAGLLTAAVAVAITCSIILPESMALWSGTAATCGRSTPGYATETTSAQENEQPTASKPLSAPGRCCSPSSSPSACG